MKSIFIYALLFSIFNIQGNAMEYYSFIIDGKKVGYYEAEMKDGILYQNALFEMNGDEYENKFLVKTENGKIVSYKAGDDEWKELSNFPENSFPSSAFDILAKKLKDGDSFEYNFINEGKNEVVGKAQLKRNGVKVIETRDGKENRYVVLDKDNSAIEYGWGGTAKSIKVNNKTEAILNTVFKE